MESKAVLSLVCSVVEFFPFSVQQIFEFALCCGVWSGVLWWFGVVMSGALLCAVSLHLWFSCSAGKFIAWVVFSLCSVKLGSGSAGLCGAFALLCWLPLPVSLCSVLLLPVAFSSALCQ